MSTLKSARKGVRSARSNAPTAPHTSSGDYAQGADTGPAAHHGVIGVAEASQLYRGDPQQRIALIRRGIPAAIIGNLSSRMGMSKENLLSSLGLSRATISRKEKNAALLSKDESERVLGVETLIRMVQNMIEQSGDPAGFDAARWVSGWLGKPLPALAGETPDSYMDTFEGQKMVTGLLALSQSGAYA